MNFNNFVRYIEKNTSDQESRKEKSSVTVATKIDEMKVMKIDACKFEDNLFDDTSIIVNCTLDHQNEYKIRAMINNDCIEYFFIDISIAHKVCESLRISSLKLNKFREVKKYDERRDKDITHVIYSFMTIQDHTKSFTSMMIIKLDQHSIILEIS
jgi:hypothetical protein